MVSKLAVACVLAVASAAFVAADFRIHSSQHSKFWAQTNRHELSLAKRGITFKAEDLPPAQWYSQTVDHFDATNPARYNQRYYVNSQYFTAGSNAPVFIMIQGEGSLSATDAVAGEHVELAQKYNALVVILEHRFYGASIPTADLSTENLRLLSSQQALADLAEFYGAMQSVLGLAPGKNAWFVFGGSYAGALTSWARVKYGDLFYGAISSSGPVNAVLEFTAYNDVVHDSLSSALVGGSDACLNAVAEAFSDIAALAATGPTGLALLSSEFLNCPNGNLGSQWDYYQFISNVAGNFQNAVQYDNDVAFNISQICAIMTNPSQSPLTNLVQVNNITVQSQGQTCVDNSWADYIASLANTTANPAVVGVGIRQWTYQTCAEFGYYQTCDSNTECPFDSPQVNLASFTMLCQQLFGISPATTQQKINFTNLYYGAGNPSGSRVWYVNGSIDPWHALSILTAPNADMGAVFIPGTSHCANMDGSKPSDTQAMTDAREQISAVLGQWIAQAQAEFAAKSA